MKVIFLDRDGTLIDEPADEIVDTWDKFKVKEGIGCLARLSENGYKFIIITNQEGIGRGKVGRSFYDEVNKNLLDILGEHSVKIEKIYTCPHTAEENCPCRKPKLGLIEQAAKDFEIEAASSWIMGDRKTDMELAQRAGMKGILIKPDPKDLCRAVDLILQNL